MKQYFLNISIEFYNLPYGHALLRTIFNCIEIKGLILNTYLYGNKIMFSLCKFILILMVI